VAVVAGPADRAGKKQQGQAEVYGIYFDFASDKIKPESEPVLRKSQMRSPQSRVEVAVEGHTDNIGGDDTTRTCRTPRRGRKLALSAAITSPAGPATPQGLARLARKSPTTRWLAARAIGGELEGVGGASDF